MLINQQMMTNIAKQAVGIDVAQEELVASLGRMSHDTGIEIYAYKTFANSISGFKSLVSWIDKLSLGELNVRYVMEATGVYHESLAYYLSDQGKQVSIVLPNKISNYFKTLDIRTITDKTASQAICRFALERRLEDWQQPRKLYRVLKQLTRERDQLIVERTALKNQMHAEVSEAFPNQSSVKRLSERIELINRHELEIKTELSRTVKEDSELSKKISLITTIPGVGRLTALVALAETNGFELIKSKKQLIGYSGLDVKVKDSGTSIKGKPRISKRGNRHLRKAMHMPALAAIRSNGPHKDMFLRLVSGHGIKMKAVVAVQRKLLALIYTIFKTGKPYDKNYEKNIINKEIIVRAATIK